MGSRGAEFIINVFVCGAGVTLAQINGTPKMDEITGAIKLQGVRNLADN
jgi:hypothetical protein